MRLVVDLQVPSGIRQLSRDTCKARLYMTQTVECVCERKRMVLQKKDDGAQNASAYYNSCNLVHITLTITVVTPAKYRAL